MKDLFRLLQRQIGELWEHLRTSPMVQLYTQEKQIAAKMDSIRSLSRQIGGKTDLDVEALQSDVLRFVRGAMSLAEMNRMMAHSLSVEHDMKEL